MKRHNQERMCTRLISQQISSIVYSVRLHKHGAQTVKRVHLERHLGLLLTVRTY